MDACLRRFTWLCIAAMGLAPMDAFADSVNSEWYAPLRTLSMGNVGIALSDDPDTSMFFNPAGLARTRKVSVEFLNPRIEMGLDDFSLVHSHLAKVGANTGLQPIQPYLAQRPKWVSSLGLALYPNLQAQNFAFGILMSGHGDSYMDSGTLHDHSQYLVVPTMGFSASMLGGRLRFGIAAHGVQLTAKNESTTTFTNLGYMQNPQEGFALAMDAGAQITIPAAGLPTFGITARNIGSTSFVQGAIFPVGQGTKPRPDIIRSTYDLGFSLQPKAGRASVFTFATDYRDVLNQTKTATLRKVNIGLELGLSKIVYIRGGERSGYWTAGFGVQSKSASLDIGTYADEMDNAGFRKVEDRRLAMQFGKRF